LVNAIDRLALEVMLDRYGLGLVLVAPEEVIPGSYWGEREAGLIGARIFVRLDTLPQHRAALDTQRRAHVDPSLRLSLDSSGALNASGWE